MQLRGTQQHETCSLAKLGVQHHSDDYDDTLTKLRTMRMLIKTRVTLIPWMRMTTMLFITEAGYDHGQDDPDE